MVTNASGKPKTKLANDDSALKEPEVKETEAPKKRGRKKKEAE